MKITSKYGYHVGDIVQNVIELLDDNMIEYSIGSHFRIVAIAPKVRIITGDAYHDSKEYFFNAVPEGQESDYDNRIRECFCTIRKVKG